MRTQETIKLEPGMGYTAEDFGADCVSDCSAPGPVDSAVASHVSRFEAPEDATRAYLKAFGAWDAEELADHAANMARLLWIAACDIRERGEWIFAH